MPEWIHDPRTLGFCAAGIFAATACALFRFDMLPEDRAITVAQELSKQCAIQKNFLESNGITDCEKVKNFLRPKNPDKPTILMKQPSAPAP